MKKLTKADIDQFVSDIMIYLEKHHLDSSVSIYANNKRFRNEYDWRKPDEPPKFIVEENMNPFDYFQYANYNHILSMAFEGPLYDELNYVGGKKTTGLEKIFEKYGCYWEHGNAWNLSAFPLDDDMEIEFTQYSKPKEPITLYHWDRENNPAELQKIMDRWFDLSRMEGEGGSCVLGAGFNFTWNREEYFMHACSPWQGSLSWERHRHEIYKMLVIAGATDIIYQWGNID